MNLKFAKLVGAGNDFVFISEENFPQDVQRAEFVRSICCRHYGVGADGVAFIKKEGPNSLVWDFYNNDGSSAEMCGNAARCAVRYAEVVLNQKTCELTTQAGLVKGQVVDSKNVWVEWDLQDNSLDKRKIEIPGKDVEGFFINSGVPHFVILNQSKSLSHDDCLAIQSHSAFGNAQTNVTLLDQSHNEYQSTKTFERGVRDFTLACGTGVIASAYVLEHLQKQETYHLQAPGGKLQVELFDKRARLTGPAQHVYTGIDYDGGVKNA